jgi:PleD family two-component response regulator
LQAAERLRADIETQAEHKVRRLGEFTLTMSFGVDRLDAGDFTALLHAVKRALHHAKMTGRNRVKSRAAITAARAAAVDAPVPAPLPALLPVPIPIVD